MAASDARLVLVAEVAGAFGVSGELKLTAYTAEPASLLSYGPLLDESGAPRLTLTAGRAAKGALVARAREIDSREGAAALRGLRLFVPRAALPPPAEEEYYLADLIGLAAVTPGGEALGAVRSVADFGAGDLLEIAPEHGASWWVAFARDTVHEVRLGDNLVVVEPPSEA